MQTKQKYMFRCFRGWLRLKVNFHAPINGSVNGISMVLSSSTTLSSGTIHLTRGGAHSLLARFPFLVATGVWIGLVAFTLVFFLINCRLNLLDSSGICDKFVVIHHVFFSFWIPIWIWIIFSILVESKGKGCFIIKKKKLKNIRYKLGFFYY